MAPSLLRPNFATRTTAAILLAYWLTLLGTSLGGDTAHILPWMLLLGFPLATLAAYCLWHITGFVPEVELHRDGLTGVGNRQAFMLQAKRKLHQAKTGTRALVIIDIDGLKEINDSCGHESGDEMLLAVADRLTTSNGQVYRIGGDEFAVLIDRHEGEGVAATLKTLEPFDLQFDACGHEHRVTFTYGYASTRKDEGVDGIYKRARNRLSDFRRQLYASGLKPDRRRDARQEQAAVAGEPPAPSGELLDSRISSLEERRRARAARSVS